MLVDDPIFLPSFVRSIVDIIRLDTWRVGGDNQTVEGAEDENLYADRYSRVE